MGKNGKFDLSLITLMGIVKLIRPWQDEGFCNTVISWKLLALIERTINTQAGIMSYADIFLFVGVVFLSSLPLLLFLGKGGAGAKAPSVQQLTNLVATRSWRLESWFVS